MKAHEADPRCGLSRPPTSIAFVQRVDRSAEFLAPGARGDGFTFGPDAGVEDWVLESRGAWFAQLSSYVDPPYPRTIKPPRDVPGVTNIVCPRTGQWLGFHAVQIRIPQADESDRRPRVTTWVAMETKTITIEAIARDSASLPMTVSALLSARPVPPGPAAVSLVACRAVPPQQPSGKATSAVGLRFSLPMDAIGPIPLGPDHTRYRVLDGEPRDIIVELRRAIGKDSDFGRWRADTLSAVYRGSCSLRAPKGLARAMRSDVAVDHIPPNKWTGVVWSAYRGDTTWTVQVTGDSASVRRTTVTETVLSSISR